jgi:putative acetyltransferase
MIIRAEIPDDATAIHQLTEQAFAPMPFSDGTEPAIIRTLRQAGNLTLSLVAEDNHEIIGHVAFSPVTINGSHDNWYGLGPISVRSDRQKQGIGTALVQIGLNALKAENAKGCALIGNPAVYGAMGFASNGKVHYENLDDKAVQFVVFSGPPPQGILKFAPAFDLEITNT